MGNRSIDWDWINHVKSQDLVWVFKCIAVSAAVFYAFVFSAPVGGLLLLSCLLLFHIPVLIVHFQWLILPPPTTPLVPEPVSSHQNSHFIQDEILVPAEADAALELFLNMILKNFITPWQSAFSTSEELFVSELRHAIRHTILFMYKRIALVNLPDIIINRVLPLCVWHLDCCAQGLNSQDQANIEQQVLLSFGSNLHLAARTRREEQQWLSMQAERLLRIALPELLSTSRLLMTLLKDLLSCQVLQKAMDTIGDPVNINRFLILWLGPDSESTRLFDRAPSGRLTPLLGSFTLNCQQAQTTEAVISLSLSTVLKKPSYMYHFMQFLKREKTLKYLQFCSAVDDFNEKLLNPEMKPEQAKELQVSAQSMFNIFIRQGSADAILFRCGDDFQSRMESIVFSRDSNDVVQLRTSPILFQAYEYAMEVLEHHLMHRFHRSPEFYNLICGVHQPEKPPKNVKKKNTSAMTGWGEKIRSAFRPSGWMEPRLIDPTETSEERNYDTGIDLTEADFIPDDMDADVAGSYADLIPICGRDLTAWRVCIPRVVMAVDVCGKTTSGAAFEVDVQRIDLRPDDDPDEYHWSVVRTYHEFYCLESQLSEFHGDLVADLRLPPRKMFGTRSAEFLQTVRLEFESFLRALLQQPALKGSDSIFSFLTLSHLSNGYDSINSLNPQEGLLVGANLLPDLRLGRIMRHVPLKLRVERGQHLDTFLNTFVASTEAPRPKPSRVENREPSSEVSPLVIKELHPLYLDNARSYLSEASFGSFSERPQHLDQLVQFPVPLDGPYECLLYMAWKIWKVPRLVWNVLVGLQASLAWYFDQWTRYYVTKRLNQALQPSRIVEGIELLHELVANGTTSAREEGDQYRRVAWHLIRQTIPDWMSNRLGAGVRIELIFQCLQYPVFNKQLSYALLDLFLKETCPEMFTGRL